MGFDKNLFFVNPFSNVYRLIGVRKNKIGRGVFRLRYLVVKAQKKNEAAFVQLMEMNKQGMYKVAKSYLHHEEGCSRCYAEYDTYLL